jgi:hypothetical protein
MIKSRRVRSGHVPYLGKITNPPKIKKEFVKSEGNRPLIRPRCKTEG